MAHGPRSQGRSANQPTRSEPHTGMGAYMDFVISRRIGHVGDLVAHDLDPAHAADVYGSWLYILEKVCEPTYTVGTSYPAAHTRSNSRLRWGYFLISRTDRPSGRPRSTRSRPRTRSCRRIWPIALGPRGGLRAYQTNMGGTFLPHTARTKL